MISVGEMLKCQRESADYVSSVFLDACYRNDTETIVFLLEEPETQKKLDETIKNSHAFYYACIHNNKGLIEYYVSVHDVRPSIMIENIVYENAIYSTEMIQYLMDTYHILLSPNMRKKVKESKAEQGQILNDFLEKKELNQKLNLELKDNLEEKRLKL